MMTADTDFQLREALLDDNPAPVAAFVRENGINAGFGGKFFKPLLVGASMFNARNVVRMLLRKGADVNARSWNESTPLHAVVSGGSPEILRMLLRNGKAKVDARNKRGETPMCLAAKMDRRICAEILRKKGADPNAEDSEGHTARSYEAAHLSVRECIIEGLANNA